MSLATLPDSGCGYTFSELNRLLGPVVLLQSCDVQDEKHVLFRCSNPQNALSRHHSPCEFPGPEASLACEVCRFVDEEEETLLCDACGIGWPTTCLDPPLSSVPKGDRLCPCCVTNVVTLENIAVLRTSQANPMPVQAPMPPALFKDATTR
eukprot:1148930-Pelagomonas_calceolata.AAC.1